MRRLLGILIAAAGPTVVVASFLTNARLFAGRHAVAGYLCLSLGLLIAALNFYLSFLRAPLIRWRSGADPVRHVSGIPLLGMIVYPGLALSPPSVLISALVGLQLLCDTHSLTWFVLATWRDASLWSAPTPRPG